MVPRIVMMLLLAAVGMGLAGCGKPLPNVPGRVSTVAAEDFYGDLLRQVGGNRVTVYTIINSPAIDPHEYEPTTRDAVAVEQAKLVLMNGLGYDSWMDSLLAGSPSSSRSVIVAGQVARVQLGSNPHVWYKVHLMARLAGIVAARLSSLQPTSKSYFARRQRRFEASLQPLYAMMTSIRQRHHGAVVAATEPVFNYMLQTLRLRYDEEAFQHAIEEGIDPSPSAVASFTMLLESHRAQALIYNRQAVEPITQTMASLARRERIPVVPVTETEPPRKDYQTWIRSQLEKLARALR